MYIVISNLPVVKEAAGRFHSAILVITVRCGSLCQDCTDGSAVLATIANAYFHSAALLDFINSLASVLGSMLQRGIQFPHQIVDTVSKFLSLFRCGLGWICPAMVGFVIGLELEHAKKSRPTCA